MQLQVALSIPHDFQAFYCLHYNLFFLISDGKLSNSCEWKAHQTFVNFNLKIDRNNTLEIDWYKYNSAYGLEI